MHRTRTPLGAIAAAFIIGCTESTTPGGDPPLSIEVAYDFAALAPTDFVTNFDFTDDGTLWAVFFEGSIIRVRQGQATHFDGTAILGASPVRDLFIDSSGRPWVTAGSAIAVYDGDSWQRQDPPHYMGLSPKPWHIAVNPAGEVLVGVGDADAGGLMLRRGTTWESITPANSILPSRVVHDIEVAPDGSFWVASGPAGSPGGLSRVAGGSITALFDKRSGLLYDWIDDLAIGDGRIWVAYAVPIFETPGFPDGGMQSLPLAGGMPATWFPFQAGLGSNRVRSIVVSSSGDVWFTTGLDEDSGCQSCLSSIGVLETTGNFVVVSSLNSPLAPNEFLPQIREGADGGIYVARADENHIVKVSR